MTAPVDAPIKARRRVPMSMISRRCRRCHSNKPMLGGRVTRMGFYCADCAKARAEHLAKSKAVLIDITLEKFGEVS